MFYPDLSLYTYDIDDATRDHINGLITVLNVGWLDSQHQFQTGIVPHDFPGLVLTLCEQPYNKMRGFHSCPFCQDHPMNDKRFVINGEEKVINLPSMLKVQWQEKEIALGNGEIRVPGEEGVVYAAPTLIYHYITAHSYHPPEEFIQAVINHFQQM